MRIRELRRAIGISQVKMAMDLHTNQNTISRYETGEREPCISDLIRIADYFNVSVDYLLERTENSKPSVTILGSEQHDKTKKE